jgi:hypothetical protein
MTSYKDHDTNTDPILVLPCGHFFAMSSLDGHFGMPEVYERAGLDTHDCIALKPLSLANINEKPRTCPDCRRIAHSIYRYGRIFRLSELRALERKYKVFIDQELACLERIFDQAKEPSKNLLRRINQLERRICKGPMVKVYEACSESKISVDIPKPPNVALIRVLELLGRVHANETTVSGDEQEKLAIESYYRAIALADQSKSIRSGARIRLRLVTTITRMRESEGEIKDNVLEHLNWVLTNGKKFDDLYQDAARTKASLLDTKKEIAQVMMAVSSAETGYNYGTSWSSHWYECPNGHPYYIGECGGAMQESFCPECKERVGGHYHNLNPSNRQVGGIFAQALSLATRHSAG